MNVGVSLYYSARRERGLSDDERHRIAEIVAEENRDLRGELNMKLPRWKADGTVPSWVTDANEICEGLSLHEPDTPTDDAVILEGSSKVSHMDCGTEPMSMQLAHYAQFSLGRLRSAIPDAEWDVHIDGQMLSWDERYGEYCHPGD
jgi:hypothetical protein